MAISSSSSRIAAGSGRSYQLRWNDFSQVTGNVGNNGLNRDGTTGVAVASNVTQGAPPGQGTLQRKGLRCWDWGSATGGACVAAYFNTWLEPMRNATSFPYGLDPWGVIELRALLSIDRTAQDINDTHDMGIGISPGNNNQNMNNPAVGAVYRAGAQFGPAGNGKVRFRSRANQSSVGPPAYSADFDTTNTVVAGFDEREWHWYALRMVSGASGQVGVCKALLDGVLFSQVNMDDTTAKFPNSSAGIGGAFGFRMGVTNATNGLVDFLYIASLHLIMAPTEADL
jgi:hypothetical protein